MVATYTESLLNYESTLSSHSDTLYRVITLIAQIYTESFLNDKSASDGRYLTGSLLNDGSAPNGHSKAYIGFSH